MAGACVTVLCVSVPGCILTAITAAGVGGILVAIIVILLVLLPLPVYWHEKGNEDRREAMLVLLWTVVLAAILRYPLLIGARLRMPLRDSAFAGIDRSLGFNVPAVMEWAARCGWAGTLLNRSYALLLPLLLLAIFLPALAGRRKRPRNSSPRIASLLRLRFRCLCCSLLSGPGHLSFPGPPGPATVRKSSSRSTELRHISRDAGTGRRHHVLSVLPCYLGGAIRPGLMGISPIAGSGEHSGGLDFGFYHDDRLALFRGRAGRVGGRRGLHPGGQAYLLGWKGTATRNVGSETARSIELEHCRTDSIARQISRQA